MNKRTRIKEHIKNRAVAIHMAKTNNYRAKFLKIQEQFKERSNKRYEGKRVMTEDVIEELSTEWCLSVTRIEAILRMKLD